MITLVPGSVTVQQGVLTGGARTDGGRVVYVEVATSALTDDQKRRPIPDLVVALAQDLLAGNPSPATIVLDSGPPQVRPDSRTGEPVSQIRKEAIEAILNALRAPL
jgi:hypothetical protein